MTNKILNGKAMAIVKMIEYFPEPKYFGTIVKA